MFRKVLFAALAVAPVAFFAGCNYFSDASRPGKAEAPVQSASPRTTPADTDHEHKAGGHGGILVEIGRDSYHAEAVFEKGGVVRLFTLGRDEARLQEVESQTLIAYARRQADGDAIQFKLEPVPQPGDAEGKTSQFVGTLPEELQGRAVIVSVPIIRIAGERYRIPSFQSAALAHAETDMPPKVAADEEKQLYLTPGGKYTEADINANGSQTASQKYQGFAAAHDPRPKAGEKICPITDTKANPKCTWVVGGKTYEFCCPPCIDEFVQVAKDRPDEIKEPELYKK